MNIIDEFFETLNLEVVILVLFGLQIGSDLFKIIDFRTEMFELD